MSTANWRATSTLQPTTCCTLTAPHHPSLSPFTSSSSCLAATRRLTAEIPYSLWACNVSELGVESLVETGSIGSRGSLQFAQAPPPPPPPQRLPGEGRKEGRKQSIGEGDRCAGQAQAPRPLTHWSPLGFGGGAPASGAKGTATSRRPHRL